MSKFNVGDKVISKGHPNLGEEVGVVVGIDTREEVEGKYLVKFDSLDEYTGWACRVYINDPYYIIEPYEGYAVWLDDLVKVEEECKGEYMSKFNIGDKVIAKDSSHFGREIGVVVGIDPREDITGKYLVKFDSLDMCTGWAYGVFVNNPYYNIEPYEGRAIWLDDLEKVENESEEECKEEENEEDIKIKFNKIREQKKEIVKEISEKVLEMTLEIKEMEHEIEKIKKEWHLD